MKSILSLLSERREMRASNNAILGLGVGSNPGPPHPKFILINFVFETKSFDSWLKT
jgi:hypothetical protein